MSRRKPGVTEYPCGCSHDVHRWLALCPKHEAEWIAAVTISPFPVEIWPVVGHPHTVVVWCGTFELDLHFANFGWLKAKHMEPIIHSSPLWVVNANVLAEALRALPPSLATSAEFKWYPDNPQRIVT